MAGLEDVFTNIINRLRAVEGAVRSVSSYYNLCVNSGFSVWTAGAGPFTANGAQIADKWFIVLGAGSAVSIMKDTTHTDALFSDTCVAVTYTHVAESTIKHTVNGPFVGSPVGISVRVRSNTPLSVRLKVGSVYGAYHSGSDQYETLILPVRPTSNPFDVEVAFDASCTAYIDNLMCVQGMGPISYIPLTTQDNARRIADY